MQGLNTVGLASVEKMNGFEAATQSDLEDPWVRNHIDQFTLAKDSQAGTSRSKCPQYP